MKSPPPLIGILISNPLDRKLIASSLKEMGYAIRDPIPTRVDFDQWKEIQLILVDQQNAARYAQQLLTIKQGVGYLFVPIIILLNSKEMGAIWLKRGFDDFFCLPLTKAELQVRLEVFLRLREYGEKRYKELVENAFIGLYRITPDGNFQFANNTFLKMLGYTSLDELAGKNIRQLYAKGDTPPQIRSGLKKEGKVLRSEVSLKTDDGSEIVVLENVWAIHDGKGEVIGYEGAIEDISILKQLETSLKEEKEFSRMIIETADVLIMGIDFEGRVLLVNKKVEQVIGYKREELIGKNLFEVTGAEGSIFYQLVDALKAGKTIQPRDTLFTTKEGEKRIISSQGTLLKDKQGNAFGILGIGSDVTERRQMEEKLRNTEKLRTIGELASGVAHDFNNVLTAIIGRAQLLQMLIKSPSIEEEKRKSAAELEEGLKVIVEAAKDGAEIVRRIQQFARRRREDRKFSLVDIREVIDRSLEFTRIRWEEEAKLRGVTITVKKEVPFLPSVMGNISELVEVFTNLINNAIDAMSGGGEITIRALSTGDHLTITVDDTGCGIPESLKEKIFKPFFTTKGPHSTGLGMSITREIINRHGGNISVDTTYDKGTRFIITLPL